MVSLVNVLCNMGLVWQSTDDRVGLTPHGVLDESTRHVLNVHANDWMPAWADLFNVLKDGKKSKTDTWDTRSKNLVVNDSFQNIMTESLQDLPFIDYLPLDAFNIVDIGGGYGSVLDKICYQYPKAEGVLFEQPHVVDRAAEHICNPARIALVSGNFFESVPSGYDYYTLINILHDWDDESCEKILRNVSDAMRKDSILIVAETFLPQEYAPDAQTSIMNLHLMTVLGGKKRKQFEVVKLLKKSGFGLTANHNGYIEAS